MNLIDLVVIALVAGAVAHGLMLGAAIQVASFAGLWAGLTLGAALAPVVARADGSPGWRAVLALVTLLAVTAAVSGGARAIGV
ncbi:MAG: hypothetical protein JWO37_2205, partial [Acidimicrobiales bacterium]|nr:hypothetical protein [Acidimicrobiales bacterium]